MGKRFTATEKWGDMWFRSLSIKNKLLWIYILDTCDNAGMWEPDLALASFQIGQKITVGDLQNFTDRLIPVSDKYFIPKFIEFQYKQLNWDSYPHRPVIEKLKKYDLIDEHHNLKCLENKGSFRVVGTPVSGAQYKEKEKDKEKEEESKHQLEIFCSNLTSVSKLRHPKYEEWEKLISDFGEQAVKDILLRMENYKDIKKYTSIYLTANNWLKKNKTPKKTQSDMIDFINQKEKELAL